MDAAIAQQEALKVLSVGQHRSGDARARTNFRAIIREVLMRAEPATVLATCLHICNGKKQHGNAVWPTNRSSGCCILKICHER